MTPHRLQQLRKDAKKERFDLSGFKELLAHVQNLSETLERRDRMIDMLARKTSRLIVQNEILKADVLGLKSK